MKIMDDNIEVIDQEKSNDKKVIVWSDGLKAKYQNLWDSLVIREFTKYPDGNTIFWKKELTKVVNKLLTLRKMYQEVELKTGCAWQLIGAIHSMECGFSITHLHNGDVLSERTTHVPKGRPLKSNPPFSWIESAVDAIEFDNLEKIKTDNIPYLLFRLELYNGKGYLKMDKPSPYLWSGSHHYSKGKYVKDGVYDPNAISKQLGGALILKELIK